MRADFSPFSSARFSMDPCEEESASDAGITPAAGAWRSISLARAVAIIVKRRCDCCLRVERLCRVGRVVIGRFLQKKSRIPSPWFWTLKEGKKKLITTWWRYVIFGWYFINTWRPDTQWQVQMKYWGAPSTPLRNWWSVGGPVNSNSGLGITSGEELSFNILPIRSIQNWESTAISMRVGGWRRRQGNRVFSGGARIIRKSDHPPFSSTSWTILPTCILYLSIIDANIITPWCQFLVFFWLWYEDVVDGS